MSLAISMAKRQLFGPNAAYPFSTTKVLRRQRLRGVSMGDPGLFSGIGKLLGGVAKTVGKVVASPIGGLVKTLPGVGTVLGAAGMIGDLFGQGRKSAGASQTRVGPGITPMATAGLATAGVLSLPSPGDLLSGLGLVPSGGPDEPSQSLLTGQTKGGRQMIPSGYHWNKSRYYIDHPLIPGSEVGQEIEAGTRLVRNRRMNPFNPTAASRSMRRLAALTRATRQLEKQLTRMAPKPRHRTCAPRGRVGKKC